MECDVCLLLTAHRSPHSKIVNETSRNFIMHRDDPIEGLLSSTAFTFKKTMLNGCLNTVSLAVGGSLVDSSELLAVFTLLHLVAGV